jgi:hypothetical protein
MDAHTIDVLSTLDPESSLPHRTTGEFALDKRWSPLHDKARDRFLSKYIRTGFGYYIATKFATHGLPFPLVMLGRDQWVYRAYLMRVDTRRNFDRCIAEAYHLAQITHNEPALGSKLKAMLMSFTGDVTPEQHIKEVAVRTGVPYDVLDAFEILFFNVIDRREDGLYLAREFYPDTRLVTFDENYLKNSTHADLIKRVAFDHRNMDLTSYLVGIGDLSYLKKVAASENREAELTRYLMGNGLILSHTNLLNQRSIGMSRVASLLAASRQGGQKQDEPPIGGIAPLFSTAFARAIDVNQDRLLRQMETDSGMPVLDI